jgi:hypothetical protein
MATAEDLRRYPLHLVDHGTSPVSPDATVTGWKFFFAVALRQPEPMAGMQPVREPRVLPDAPGLDKGSRQIAAAGNRHHQTTLPAGRDRHEPFGECDSERSPIAG